MVLMALANEEEGGESTILALHHAEEGRARRENRGIGRVVRGGKHITVGLPQVDSGRKCYLAYETMAK